MMKSVLLIAGVVGLSSCGAANAQRAEALGESVALLSDPVGVVIYVNPINCEMSASDANRLNAIDSLSRVGVHVVFLTLSDEDSATVSQARADLGLRVPTSSGVLPAWAEQGGLPPRVPLAFVVRDRAVTTVVSGESMQRDWIR